MRSFLVPTFEQDLVRIIDVHLDGFGQPSCNRLIGFATWSKKLECQNPNSSTRIGIGIWGGSTSVREIYNTIQNTIEFVQFLQPKKPT